MIRRGWSLPRSAALCGRETPPRSIRQFLPLVKNSEDHPISLLAAPSYSSLNAGRCRASSVICGKGSLLGNRATSDLISGRLPNQNQVYGAQNAALQFRRYTCYWAVYMRRKTDYQYVSYEYLPKNTWVPGWEGRTCLFRRPSRTRARTVSESPSPCYGKSPSPPCNTEPVYERIFYTFRDGVAKWRFLGYD